MYFSIIEPDLIFVSVVDILVTSYSQKSVNPKIIKKSRAPIKFKIFYFVRIQAEINASPDISVRLRKHLSVQFAK